MDVESHFVESVKKCFHLDWFLIDRNFFTQKNQKFSKIGFFRKNENLKKFEFFENLVFASKGKI